MPSLAELRGKYVRDGARVPPEVLDALRSDPRKGAAQLLRTLESRRDRARAEADRCHRMTVHERELFADGIRWVAGVDEVGMSPWAGPIVAAAVVLVESGRESDLPAGIRDSKTVPEAERERLAEQIRARAVAWAVGSASPEDIARLNVFHAGRLAMRRAVAALRPQPHALLVDARQVPGFGGRQVPIVKGDASSLSIAAASILAKATRDRFMRGMDRRHPGYGFGAHKGYGTAQHQDALRRLGGTPEHRWCFDCVRAAAGLPAERNGQSPATESDQMALWAG